ncbi:hypothetical protein E2C01_095789 [Portunus trituberculatus]|uniref:Uncharacterized protein n=1 Tax=Portunus trituberculatus TaxID=210409 RepID=A0A5B7K6M2_PORTR|nr:hypothetical protein [Portunus trituberculatus]
MKHKTRITRDILLSFYKNTRRLKHFIRSSVLAFTFPTKPCPLHLLNLFFLSDSSPFTETRGKPGSNGGDFQRGAGCLTHEDKRQRDILMHSFQFRFQEGFVFVAVVVRQLLKIGRGAGGRAW